MSESATPPEGHRQYRFEAAPEAVTVLLVRHGESAPAHPDRPFPLVDGQGDPALAPTGREQARRLAQRLGSERIDAIYVTTMRRTHETAAPLARLTGLEPIELADLREVHLGEWEGGVFRHKAVAGDPLFARIFEEERWDVIPGGELLGDFDERIRRGLDRIVATHRGQRVVAVLHGGVIGHVLHMITGSRRFAFAGADNASISEIVVDDDRALLRRYNDTTHLDGLD